jgi:lactate permease
MLALILLANGVGPLRRALGAATLHATIYSGPGASPLAIPLLLTPGTLIFVAALAGGSLQGASPRVLAATLGRTARQLAAPALTVIALDALARLMTHSGMIAAVAVALAGVAGGAAPFVAPWLGALGAFVTGSDTSANVLFGALQVETARRIGADPCWIAAANATGATAGKMISPQSIAVAVAATGQAGAEGRLLRTMLPWCAIYSLILGLIVLAGALATAAR